MPDVGVSANDPSSFAKPDEAQVVNIHLALDVDFSRQVLSGTATLTVERQKDGIDRVILDTKDLKILAVRDQETGKILEYSLEDPVKCFGSKLVISLPGSSGKRFIIAVDYETSPQSSGLQWLSPEQTAGKYYPYLFSQCQAIHCRSVVPCQDTPAVKAPYTAEVTAPEALVVLMSAVQKGEPFLCETGKKLHKFQQKIPIPSYLIAIVVGALESRKIGPRSHVWSEKEFVDKAAYEFAETETMLSKAESLCGPYVWGIYDLLVLPPSFAVGGMENPCLTFVTPTLLAGDRSLADVIAHEIAHSWTGNLVTNRNFEHFWLNEGFTVFMERKITGRMFGEKHRHFSAIGGWKELSYAIDTRGSEDPLTCLIPKLQDVDPDDAFSTVPYEKGHTFLWYLESMLGGPAIFESFLRAYIDKYKYKSVDSDDFKSYLLEYFSDDVKKGTFKNVNWDAWFHTAGMPPVKPEFDDTLARACTDLCKQWVTWNPSTPCPFNAEDMKVLSPQQKREFLAQLLEEEPLQVSKVEAMEKVYGFTSVMNSEIRFRWLRLCIRAKWKDQVPKAIKFVTEQGRMKFVRPIFRDLYEWEDTRETAIETYKKHKSQMMYVTACMVGKDLKLYT